MVKPYSSPRGKSRNAPATARKKTAESGKAKARPRKAPSGDAEKRILEAARKEFIAKGLDGARMQAVAASAGVNKALLHYYFRSKEKLYARVLEEILGAVWGELAGEFRARSPEAGLEPMLRTVVSTYVRTLAANPEFPLFVFRELSGGGERLREGLPELIRRFQEVPATMARVLREETEAGNILPIAPVHFFMNLMGMTVGTFLIMPVIRKLGPAYGISIDFDEAFMEERIQSITGTFLNGIRIRRAV